MFEQAFRTIDDILFKESGCTTELDYTEQTSGSQPCRSRQLCNVSFAAAARRNTTRRPRNTKPGAHLLRSGR
jgi:hypothetical protein